MAELSNSSGDNLSDMFPELRSIRKSNISETYQYLNKFIQGKSMRDYKNLQKIISTETLSLFDTSLQLIIIDSFQLKDEVIKIILSQDDIRIKRVLHCKWFFKNLSSEFCTKEIFPHVSLSLRCKIINELSKHLESTEEAEKYFMYIREVYDNDRADYLLPRCSPEFILKHFQESKNKFESHNSSRVLLNICKRYPEIGIQIFFEIFSKKNECLRYNIRSFKKVLEYLVGHHLNLFVTFFEKHHSHLSGFHFGNKSTKKIVRKINEEVLDSMKEVILKEKAVFMALEFEGKANFIARLVRLRHHALKLHSWKMTNYTLRNLLKLVPSEKRLEIVKKAFRKVYNLNYDDCSVCWSSDILKLIPFSQRQPYVNKIKELLKEDPSDLREVVDDSFSLDRPEDVALLLDSKTAFEELKYISRFSPSPSKREKLLGLMVENCSINNDTEVLQEVIDYVTGRCRNEEYSVVAHFTQNIRVHFPSSSLTLSSIEKILDLMLLFEVKFDRSAAAEWKERRIYHFLENNMDVEDLVKDFFESYVLPSQHSTFIPFHLESKHKGTLLMKIFEKAVEWMEKNPEKEEVELKLVESIIFYRNMFNRGKSGKSGKIQLKNIPGFWKIMRKYLKKNFADFGGENWPLTIYDKLETKVFKDYFKKNCILYALKNDPSILDKHLVDVYKYLCSVFLESGLNNSVNFLTFATSFYDKTNEAKDILRKEMKNETKQINVIKLFSHMCTLEEFCEAVDEFIPKESKVLMDSHAAHVQMSLPRIIKNIKPRWRNLELILKFYFGDFLKPAQTALNSWAHHARTDTVLPFLLNKLKELPENISYRKNILRLIVELSGRRERLEYCMKFWNEYEHYSIRSILLKYVKKTFFERPTKEAFKALEKCIVDSDKLTIESRPEFEKIPKEFVGEYVEALWKFSESLESYERKNFRRDIVRHINNDNVNDVREEFVESIIQYNLYSAKSEVDACDLSIYYMMSEPKKTNRALKVFNLIKERKPSPYNLNFFFRNFLALLRNDGLRYADLLTFAMDNWPDYPATVLFETRVLMKLQSLHVKVLGTGRDVSVGLGQELKNFFATVENLTDLTPLYAEILKEFLGYFKLREAVAIARELIGGSFDRTLAIVGILSLRSDAIELYGRDGMDFGEEVIETKRTLKEMVNVLKEYKDEVIDIYLKSKVTYLEDQ